MLLSHIEEIIIFEELASTCIQLLITSEVEELTMIIVVQLNM